MVNRLPFKTLCAATARWMLAERAKLVILAAVGASAGLLFISCGTPPVDMAIPFGVVGADFVGSDTCAGCHEEISRDFKTADHARLMARGDNAANVGCESCHGPGNKHVEAGGGAGTIINPHKSAEGCYQCHLEIKAKFTLPYRHPVPEGKITCTDCHDPHKGGAIKNGGTARSMNETCYQCHSAQRGPFVFSHEATREGCVTCHDPHGSVNAKQLVARDATLCMKCHYQGQQTPGGLSISEGTHNTRVRGGTCWSGGCHEAVHGSQVNAHLRY